MADNGVVCSMSRSGNVWDNADGELLLLAEDREDRQKGLPYVGCRQGRRVDYIERFYNTIRRHSTIGYLSPVEFERKVALA
jgi:putative transposase